MASTQAKFSALFSRRQPGGVYTVADIVDVPGDVFFVDSAATGASNAATHGTTPDTPFATLAYAFSSDRVTSGDVVYVMPGHAETVDAAGDITMDIAGVRVVGLGRGSSRPTFTWSTATAATWLITAANVSVENVLITCTGAADFASAITVTAADVALTDIEIRDSGATSQFSDTIIIGTGGARCKVVRPVVRSHASGDAAQSGVLISAVVDGVEIDDALIDGLYATGCIESTAAATNTVIRRPILRQRHATQDAAINMNATNTGYVLSPRVRTATDDAAGFTGALVGADMQFYDALVVNADGQLGAAASGLTSSGGGSAVSGLGTLVSKASGAITGDPTTALFTVTGGEVMITALWGVVTTSITQDGGTIALQTNPTTGDTVVVVAATDLGTTDTAAGTTLGVVDESTTTPDFRKGGRALTDLVATTGAVEMVGASSVNGAITFYCTWLPLTDGATLVAA